VAAAAGHAPGVLSARDDVLAISDSRGTVRLWNALTRQVIGRPVVSRHAVTGLALSAAYALAFSPDGTTLVTADSDGRARSWDVAFPAGLLAGACAIADQSLTRQQWAGYAGTQPFQQVCPAS
jgi:WD40 repeat protein